MVSVLANAKLFFLIFLAPAGRTQTVGLGTDRLFLGLQNRYLLCYQWVTGIWECPPGGGPAASLVLSMVYGDCLVALLEMPSPGYDAMQV